MTETPSISKNPIIIVGAPRSGTTLLRTMLGNHPEILTHPEEPQFILGLYQRYGPNIKDVSAAITYLTDHKYCPESFDRVKFRDAFHGIVSTTLKSFILKYIQIWAGAARKEKHLMIKHPELVYYLDLISYLFPEARILHIIRDPRSNVSSQRNRWPQFSIWDCCMRWKTAIRKARKWGRANPSRYLEINYEHLVIDPETALTEVLERVGLAFSTRLLTFEFPSTRYERGRQTDRVAYSTTDPSRLELWKSSLSPLVVRIIEYACEREMRYWDYQTTAPPVSRFLFIITLIVEWSRHQVYRLGRWIKTFGRRIRSRLGLFE